MNPPPVARSANPDGRRWLISEDSAGLFPIHTGIAETEAAAWTAAYAAGCDALLAGRIQYLAIAVDDEIPTLGYSPSRDGHGRLDPDHVKQYLGELLHDTLCCLRPLDSGWPGEGLRRDGPRRALATRAGADAAGPVNSNPELA